MGYLHIDNLYKNTEILNFKECYAMEKIHGTSAHISWKENKVSFFSGGESHSKFLTLFDEDKLTTTFEELFEFDVILFGEAYGGKQQGMSETYGKELKFIVFDVKVGDFWLDVLNAKNVADKLGLDFVDFVKCATDIEKLDFERDRPSTQAKLNGIKEDRLREGVVLRPLIELKKNNGDRIIVKHKHEKFLETRTKREVNPERLIVLEEAEDIAKEWVTPMRLNHVLDKLGNPDEITAIGDVIKEMIKDVFREAEREIVESKEASKSIGKLTAKMYKSRISKIQEARKDE